MFGEILSPLNQLYARERPYDGHNLAHHQPLADGSKRVGVDRVDSVVSFNPEMVTWNRRLSLGVRWAARVHYVSLYTSNSFRYEPFWVAG